MEAIGIVAAFILAGFSSGAREALAALESNEKLTGKSAEEGSDRAVLRWWRQRQRAVVMVFRVGHRLGLVAATALAVSMGITLFGAGNTTLAILVPALTLGAVIVGDVIPNALARSHPRRLAIIALHLVRLPYLLLLPVTKLLLLVRRMVRKVVGEDKSLTYRFEVATVLRAIFAEDRPQLEQRQMLLRSVTGFPNIIVREVMVPRTDMVVISREMDIDEILLTLLECGHSRIPVYGSTHDEIVGLFYAKDVIQLMASGQKFEIDDFLRRPYFVPETKPITELLNEFRSQRIHMAVVVDEFGGTAGLITLEDIIEEFFGDIQDEYDVEPSQLVELTSDRVMADARIGVDEIEEYFDVEFPVSEDYDSLGGFLLSCAGNVPQPGEEIRWKNLIFRIVEADAKRIDSVEIEPVPPEQEATELVG